LSGVKVDLRTGSLVSLPSAALIYCRAYVMSDYVSFTCNVFIRIRFSVKWFFARHCVLYRPKTWVLNKIQTSSPRKFVNVLTRQNSPYWLMLFIRCSTGTGYICVMLTRQDKTVYMLATRSKPMRPKLYLYTCHYVNTYI